MKTYYRITIRVQSDGTRQAMQVEFRKLLKCQNSLQLFRISTSKLARRPKCGPEGSRAIASGGSCALMGITRRDSRYERGLPVSQHTQPVGEGAPFCSIPPRRVEVHARLTGMSREAAFQEAWMSATFLNVAGRSN